MAVQLRSFAKINLGLAIGPVRADGFHDLVTLYHTIAAHDLLTVDAGPATKTTIRLTSNDARVPLDARNTAWKMAALALKAAGVAAEVSIHIEKRLPVQGGLGAGSANAAAALIGLERELGLELGLPRRLALAAQVGSDVPLFLLGGAVLGLGRGEQVYPLPELAPGREVRCLVALPSVGVSTPAAFAQMDRLRLTSPPPADRLSVLGQAIAAVCSIPGSVPGESPDPSGVSSVGGDLAGTPLSALVRTGYEAVFANDFEEAVFAQHPSLLAIKRDLKSSGKALYAALSGSGSALFGLYRSGAEAAEAASQVQHGGTATLGTKLLPRSEYWATMWF